jgi:hypothetical protein
LTPDIQCPADKNSFDIDVIDELKNVIDELFLRFSQLSLEERWATISSQNEDYHARLDVFSMPLFLPAKNRGEVW